MENRPIQINDFIIVNDKYYIIESIEDNVITFFLENKSEPITLVPDRSDNYYLDGNKIKFVAGLTGNPFVDMEILVQMDDKTLTKFCQVNSYISSLCKKEELWERKLELSYKGILDHVDSDYSDIYKFLSKYNIKDNMANMAIVYGYLNVLEWLFKKGVYPNREVAIIAAAFGHLDILKWFNELNVKPGQDTVNMALKYGRIDILNWLEEEKILLDNDGLNHAAIMGNLNSLNWLEKRDIILNQQQVNDIVEFLKPKVLDWLAERDILPNVLPIDVFFAKNLDILEWLIDREIYPSQETINYTAELGYTDMLKLVISKNMFPDEHMIDIVVQNGHLDVLDLLKEKYEISDQNKANLAAGNGQLDELLYWEGKGIVPDKFGANFAAKYEHLNILNWLEDRRLYPDENGADFAAIEGKLLSLDWLEKRKILPDQERLNNVVGKDVISDVAILEWLKGRNISLDVIEKAVFNCRLEVLDWLERRRIFPDQSMMAGAILNNCMDSLIWAEKRDILPAFIPINYPLTLDMLSWLTEKNVFS